MGDNGKGRTAELLSSFLGRVKALAVGESEAKSLRIECDHATKDTLMDAIERLRNNMAATVKRATDATGNQYVVETGDIRTKSFDFHVIAIITRTA